MTHLVAFVLALGAQATTGGDAGRDLAVQLATESLSSRLGVSVQAVHLITADPVEWPDSSLGCPERGMAYLPAIVPGFRVRLEAGGAQYEIHTGGGRAVACGDATVAPAPPATRAGAPALAAADRARRQLATMLEMEPASLVVKRVRRWRATDDQCYPPAEAPVKEGESTFFVELTRGAETWRYRATPRRAWRCVTK